MTKSRITKKALFLSMVSLLFSFSMLLGTTYAWFTDTISSAGNVIQSGTLDVDLVDKDGNSMEGKVIKFVTADNRAQEAILWEPGCTYNMEPVYVVNKGNLALKYQIVINGVEGSAKLLEAIEWTVTVGEAELAERMIVYVQSKINILAEDYNVKVAGFVWMQGESDALDFATGVANRYSDNEQQLIKMVRDEFAAYATRNSTALTTPGSGIVFVNGGIAASDTVWPQHAIVNTAKRENCAWWYDSATGVFTSQAAYNIANSIFVETGTLLSKNQSYHARIFQAL